MRTPEGWEKAEIDKYLKAIGAYVVKPTTAGFGQSGHPDRIVCLYGHFVTIEVKRPGKEPTVLQERRMEQCRYAGGVAFWGDAEKVIKELKFWLTSITAWQGW